MRTRFALIPPRCWAPRAEAKVETAQIVADELRPLQERTAQYLNDRGELEKILKAGAERASAKAENTLRKVYSAIGFVPL